MAENTSTTNRPARERSDPPTPAPDAVRFLVDSRVDSRLWTQATVLAVVVTVIPLALVTVPAVFFDEDIGILPFVLSVLIGMLVSFGLLTARTSLRVERRGIQLSRLGHKRWVPKDLVRSVSSSVRPSDDAVWEVEIEVRVGEPIRFLTTSVEARRIVETLSQMLFL